ncbi:Hypothetical protein CINCED_3A014978 [Cinara cedri]|uniref:Uncharacterized protein n=1 Tax=Cinara cedri TaxID=506608 RepID=A0A5E4MBY4_9HEMI|nr:Hypothetical protein CINCED_3A014978 [Cinara cedri]
MFKQKLTRTVDGNYIISVKDVVDLDKTIKLACIDYDKSVEENQRLRYQNKHIETKCIELQVKLDEVKTNLCLALDYKVGDNRDVMHLINVCVALNARESEHQYILEEKNKLKQTLDLQLLNIRSEISSRCDELTSTVEKLKEEIIVKDAIISELINGIHSIKTTNDEMYANDKILKEKLLTELKNTKRELHEAKYITAVHIGRNHDINEHYLQVKCLYEGLRKENANLKSSMGIYQRQLANRSKQCTDNVKLMETLQSNAIEQKRNETLLADKYEQATVRIENLIYKTIFLDNRVKLLEGNLKEKCSQISTVERIANAQLAESIGIIDKLSQKCKELELKNAKYDGMQNATLRPSNTIDEKVKVNV